MSRFRTLLFSTYLWMLAVSPALFTAGATSNQLVLWANHDRFPVKLNAFKIAVHRDQVANLELPPAILQSIISEDLIDPTHCVMSNKTHLNWLADIWDFHSAIVSIGDLTMQFADWLSTPLFFVWLTLVSGKLVRDDTRG